MRTSLALSFLCLALVACHRHPVSTATPQNFAEIEEYAVYRVVVQSPNITSAKTQLIVIQRETGMDFLTGRMDETLASIQPDSPDLSPEIIADFKAKNQQSVLLKALFNTTVETSFISQAEFTSLFDNGDGWEKFYARFPGASGIITLSRVGFNQSMDTALVYIGQGSGWLNGAGYFVVLKKIDGVWGIRKQMMAWIS